MNGGHMNRFKLLSIGFVALALLLHWGCMDLAVENKNNPDALRAIASAKDVESLISGSYLTWWTGTQKDADFPALTLSTIADAHTSSWGNWGMQDMSSEPRTPWNNSTSYVYAGVNRDTWAYMYRAISSVNDGLAAINKGIKIIDDQGVDQTARARAFGKFVQGLAHCWLAVFFDKAFIVDETMDVNNLKLDFKPYGEVLAAGIKMLEDAIAICNSSTFTIPNTWINGVTLTNTQLKEVAYSYLARYRAGVARTPAERAAVNWQKVISDAQNGVKADWGPVGDGNLWWDGLKFRGQHATWTRADYKTIGETDKSGRYQNWLNTPIQSRNVFVIETDDRRITGPGGGTTNGTDFKYRSPSPFRDDRGTYHHSLYYHTRYEYHVLQGATGAMTTIKVAEMDLTIAEGLWRTGGSKQQIVDLINKTRVSRGNLPPLTTAMSNEEIFRWLKYEKMIETFSTGSGLPWFDRRGWGDLVSGSILHFPVPGKELEILAQPIYTYGGVGGQGAAPKRIFDNAPLKSIHPH